MPHSRFSLVARLLIALLFLVAGLRKLLAYGATTAYFSALGLPFPGLVAAIVIAIEIGGAIALTLGFRLAWVATGLGLFTLATAVAGHAFWSAEPAQFSAQLNNFLKNLAISGGFILLALQSLHTSRSPQT